MIRILKDRFVVLNLKKKIHINPFEAKKGHEPFSRLVFKDSLLFFLVSFSLSYFLVTIWSLFVLKLPAFLHKSFRISFPFVFLPIND